jgi:cbb3-type cytochrome oxidase cytochrome c subunit
MAATDKPFRNQYTLDIVFGVSCVLLLLVTGWMLYDDHFRSFKPIQRTFRDVEEALYVQQMDEKYPQDQIDEITEAQKKVKEAQKLVDDAKKGIGAKVGGDADAWLKKQGLEKAKLEAKYQDTKANYDSEVSLYNILVDERDAAAEKGYKDKLDAQAKAKKQVIEGMDKELQHIQHDLTENEKKTAEALADQKEAEKLLAAAQDNLKKLTDNFDRTAKLAAQKRWKTGDWFRALPIIDGFASPYKIQQVTLDDLTIEYGSFKNVPRYDRCTTCHLAIDRPAFDATALRRLDLDDKKGDSEEVKAAKKERREELKKRHAAAVKFLKERQKKDENLGFEPGDLGGDVPSIRLTDAQVRQYSAHPRLDLFVDSNSAHPMEKFGCTICHAGQGSATEFYYAVHTPNDPVQRRQWEKEHSWEPFHDWEYPMLPARFIESGCLKCHHQVTDLVREGTRQEAPKLLKGYNLVRENGCFGCHEISGLKAGKAVGPDLRLEPSPALEHLTPEERARLLSDPSNPPGTMRKVGPSLRRLSEKTNEPWARKWINSPRGFRPDTRMPHFYNLSNNDPTRKDPAGKPLLSEEQKDFPPAEIASIAHYLFAESNKYLNGNDNYVQVLIGREKDLEEARKNNTISDKQRAELIEVKRRIELAGDPRREKRYRVVERVTDEDGKVVSREAIVEKTEAASLDEGRRLFTEKGCLACHSHEGTEKGPNPVVGHAVFGPNLSRVAEKMVVLGNDGKRDADASRRWVIQWVLNPNVHFPRTRMPITHLKPEEAARIADWLLSQKVNDPEFVEWSQQDVPAPSADTLTDLARVYLRKAPGVNPLEVDDVLKNGFSDDRLDDKKNPQKIAADADEQALRTPITPDKLKYYIGKKAIGRLGCYGCHDVPGFELAKPIGTPLNDWGKKDPARLAFEDADAYVKDHFKVVELRDDPKDSAEPSKEWAEAVKAGKQPFEQFFADALDGHQRDGFLHLKLKEPRSYDYHRDVKWDDRLRMPQFKFAHPRRNKDESDEDFAAREAQAEAQAREAVMTFILGLVAEPLQGRYLNNPAPDRLAEVKGLQVLQKFNCEGCHLIRPGVFDIRLDAEDREGGSRALLQKSYTDIPRANLAEDNVYPEHNAWTGLQPLRADRLLIEGTNPRQRQDYLLVRLTEALRFESLRHQEGDKLLAFGAQGKALVDGQREVLTIPSGLDVRISPDALISRSEPMGGTLSDLLTPFLMNRNRTKFPDEDNARSALPPPLVRVGERLQPEWLAGFLRNPTQVRPETVLRMPKFNMSEDEARALVNYFAAADRTNNPGIGLTYPYMAVPERQDTYWHDRNREYAELLAKENKLQTRAEAYLKAAEERLKEARGTDKTDLEAEIKRVREALDEKDAEKRKQLLGQVDLYWSDAYKLLTMTGNNAICQKCHAIGSLKASEDQAPPLDLSWRRLRPDWTERWIGNPKRLLTYSPTMPQNFHEGNNEQFRDFFDAPSRAKVQALRDVLMNYPRVADLPVNRSYPSAAPAPGGK